MATQNYFKAKNGLEAPSQSTIAVTDSSFPTVRPTLNLDFAGSESVDSRITFTRASAATYYGADGKLKYAVQNEPRIEYDPITGECKGLLIEEQRTNLLQSQRLSSSAAADWIPQATGMTVQGYYGIAPDGTRSSTRISESSTTGQQIIQHNAGSVSSSTTYTISVYAKASGSNILVLTSYGEAETSFNLSTLVVSAGGANSGSITPVGNGWYRCVTSVPKTNTQGYFYIGITNTASRAGGGSANGIEIWGAQVEQGAFATSYIPTSTAFTSRASSATYLDSTGTLRIAGVNQARYGYGYDSTSGKWVSQGLLLESASTNYWLESTKITAWLSTTVTLNYASAPDGSISAWKAVMTNYNAGAQNAGASNSNAGTLTGRTFTYSVWLKSESGTVNMIISIGRDSMNPTVEKTVSVDTTWRRYEVTATFTGGTSWFAGINTAGSGQAATVVGWGSQVEEAYAATSYIPTYNASATRAADVSSGAATTRSGDIAVISSSNLSTWYNQSEGTVVATFDMPGISDSTSAGVVWSLSESYQNRMELFNNSGWIPDRWHPIVVNNDAWVVDGGQINGYVTPTTSIISNAFAYKQNDFATSWNAGTVATDSSGLVPQPTALYIGSRLSSSQMNGHLKRLTYYSKRLSNLQLQALTA